MRAAVSPEKLNEFMRELGRAATGPGRVYLAGGSTALLLGFRQQTVDIDLKLAPEPAGVFQAIAELKDRLSVNVELAAPDDFLPPLPDWQERSEFIVRYGPVDFYHYDFYSQALSKLLRGHEKDLRDAADFVISARVDLRRLAELFESIRPALIRYPAIDVSAFEAKVQAFLERHG